MGAMFRSEEMTLCQMFIQPEAAYSSVSELGETGAVQFRDVSLSENQKMIRWLPFICHQTTQSIRSWYNLQANISVYSQLFVLNC